MNYGQFFFLPVLILLFSPTLAVAQTAETLFPTDDAFVLADLNYEDDPDGLRLVNTGDLDFLRVWYAWNVTAAENQIVAPAYLKFDLSKYDPSKIESATLKLYANQTATSGPPIVLGIFDTAKTGWTESSVVYDTSPVLRDLRGVIQISNPGWHEIDITEMVMGSLGSNSSIGLFYPKILQQSEQVIILSSKESANIPQLILEISSPLPSNIKRTSPTDDAFVMGDRQNLSEFESLNNQTTGQSNFIRLGYSIHENSNEEILSVIFMKFDLSEIDLENIKNAKIKLKPSDALINRELISVSVIPVLDDQWNESSINFNNQPEITTSKIINTSISSINDWYEWDVTEMITQEDDSVFSFAVMPNAFTEGSSEFVEFYSNEHTISQNRPYLQVTLEEESVTETISNTELTTEDSAEGGGCLIATAAYGSELAPQVQMLRELRDNKVMNTSSGAAFISGFNTLYYSFSPAIADYERENPAFREMVKIGITPMITSMSVLNGADIDSEQEMLGYGIGIILMNLGMYIGSPLLGLLAARRYILRKKGVPNL